MSLRTRLIALGATGFLATAGAFIGSKEGLVLSVYQDVGGVATWCYGQTGTVTKQQYTRAECDGILLADVEKRWAQMEKDIPVDAPNSVKASMLSVAYHAGVSGWRHPVFLKPLAAHDWRATCAAIVAPWQGKHGISKGFKATVKGVPHRGLENRRAEEYKTCVQDL